MWNRIGRARRLRLVHKIGILALLFCALVVTGIAIGTQFSQPDDAKAELRQITQKLAERVVLPSGEEPSLATVEDPSKLKDAFIAEHAQKGDKIILYPRAGKVYVYRPSAAKLVAMAPLIIDASAQQIKGTRILVRQGSEQTQPTNEISQTLKDNYASAKFLEQARGVRLTYPRTIVIDLTEGDKYELVSNIVQLLGAERGVLPQGEPKPENVDILVIVGQDKDR